MVMGDKPDLMELSELVQEIPLENKEGLFERLVDAAADHRPQANRRRIQQAQLARKPIVTHDLLP